MGSIFGLYTFSYGMVLIMFCYMLLKMPSHVCHLLAYISIFEVILDSIFCSLYLSFIISRRALAREGDYEMMPVCACMRACVRALVTQIPPKLLQLQIFCKLIVPMNFHALENFFGFMDLGLTISE